MIFKRRFIAAALLLAAALAAAGQDSETAAADSLRTAALHPNFLVSELSASFATNLIVPAGTAGVSLVVGSLLYPFIFLPMGMSFDEAIYHVIHYPAFIALAGVSPMLCHLGVRMVGELNNLSGHWAGLLLSYAGAAAGAAVALMVDVEWGTRILLVAPPLGALLGYNLRVRPLDPDLPPPDRAERRRTTMWDAILSAGSGAALGELAYLTTRLLGWYSSETVPAVGSFREDVLTGGPLDRLLYMPLASTLGTLTLYGMNGKQVPWLAVPLGSLLGSLCGWGIAAAGSVDTIFPAMAGSAVGAVFGAVLHQILPFSRGPAVPETKIGMTASGEMYWRIGVTIPY